MLPVWNGRRHRRLPPTTSSGHQSLPRKPTITRRWTRSARESCHAGRATAKPTLHRRENNVSESHARTYATHPGVTATGEHAVAPIAEHDHHVAHQFDDIAQQHEADTLGMWL